MKFRRFAALLLAAAPLPMAAVQAVPPAPVANLHVDMDYYKLPNGLKVVLAPDASAPQVTVSIYYGIGFRIEPRERTGFAHLFEHLMFQGSANAPKGTIIKTVTNSGGAMNGSTRFDFTDYYEVVPANGLDRMLWLDADRMARPVINDVVLKNQQGVVGNEVKVNVLNRPYGTFPWIDLPMAANTNWYNSHNFYGELSAIEAATTPEAQAFAKKFYAPNNAVLVIVGDFDPAATKATIAKLFGPIPKGPAIDPADLTEPRQTAERFGTRVDAFAPQPAFAAGYHMPDRGTPEWYAMGLIDQILIQGQDSRLYQKLVQETGMASQLGGGINDLGNMFDYRGPMLFDFNFIHDPKVTTDQIKAAIDPVIDSVRNQPVSETELARARTKLLSSLYDQIDVLGRLGLVDLLASYALFDDNPQAVNHLADGFAKVTPALLQKTAQEYLRPGNRTIYVVQPGAKGGAQ